MANPFVHARSLSMSFGGGAPVLAGVEFDVGAGDFVSLVGPSGCGKSTLLRLVAGLEAPTEGTVEVDGRRPEAARGDGVAVAFVFQDATLLPWRTVTENIRLPMELQGVPRAEQAGPVEDALRLIGLTGEDAGKRPRMLSGGMRMRVSLARALVTEPRLMLMDEPFGALDDITRQRLNQDVQRLWHGRRWSTLFVTHNTSEAVYLSRRVLVMSSQPGRIVAEVEVPFEYPRGPELRSTAEFARLTGEVASALREASS